MKIETILTPAELTGGTHPGRNDTACVVFDILRATSTFVTALHNGAKEIIPVRDIPEAVALRQKLPHVLLAGERDGVKIRAAQSGGIDFDFGNSPREFTPDKIRGGAVVSTTTNGTLALRSCVSAKTVLAASFLNLAATVEYLHRNEYREVLLVCAGTGDQAALEDVLAAGALAELLATRSDHPPACSDATEIARRTYLQAQVNFSAVFGSSQNARRLLAIPELSADVDFCRQRDVFNLVAEMSRDGAIRRL